MLQVFNLDAWSRAFDPQPGRRLVTVISACALQLVISACALQLVISAFLAHHKLPAQLVALASVPLRFAHFPLVVVVVVVV